jgi:hypothetical protein
MSARPPASQPGCFACVAYCSEEQREPWSVLCRAAARVMACSAVPGPLNCAELNCPLSVPPSPACLPPTPPPPCSRLRRLAARGGSSRTSPTPRRCGWSLRQCALGTAASRWTAASACSSSWWARVSAVKEGASKEGAVCAGSARAAANARHPAAPAAAAERRCCSREPCSRPLLLLLLPRFLPEPSVCPPSSAPTHRWPGV